MNRLAFLAATLSALIVLLMVVIGGATTPGYDHTSQYISELGATGAAQEWPVRMMGFLPAGVLLLSFCAFAYVSLPRSPNATWGLAGLALYAAGYLVAAAFPCDLGCRPAEPSISQVIHNAGGLIGYLLAPGFLFVLARAAREWPGGRRVEVAGYAASMLALGGVLSLSPSSPVAGLNQRLLEFAVLGWVVICGVYLLSRRGPDAPRT